MSTSKRSTSSRRTRSPEMSADDLGLGEPEEFEPDSRAESIRQGGIGVVSVAVVIAAVVAIVVGLIVALIWILPLLGRLVSPPL